jgi:hypothetical protein
MPISGALAWIGKKIWDVFEGHAERRTKAVEAIAPSIKASFDEMRKHVTDHADEQAKTVEKAESNVIAAVTNAKAAIIEQIGVSQRLERVELHVATIKAKDLEDPTAPERFEGRPSRHPSASGVQSLRESRPAIVGR